MKEITSIPSDETSSSKYDLNKGEGDLQRYFIYKTVKENGVDLLKGECRKCQNVFSRINGATTSMVNHQEKCDSEAWKIYKTASKSRKRLSAPSTPNQQIAIDSIFTVKNFP